MGSIYTRRMNKPYKSVYMKHYRVDVTSVGELDARRVIGQHVGVAVLVLAFHGNLGQARLAIQLVVFLLDILHA